MQLVQNNNTLFATIFVYNPANLPIWYSGTLFSTGINPATGAPSFAGDLYETRGPWLGATPYQPSQVQLAKVGTISFTSPAVETGVLTYSVNGVSVTKQVQRQTLVFDNYSGTFLGTYSVDRTNCSNPANNGRSTFLTSFAINHSTNAMTIVAAITNGIGTFTCTFSGAYSQAGRMAAVNSTYACTTGESGNVQFIEMTRERLGVLSRLKGTNNLGCKMSGSLSALD